MAEDKQSDGPVRCLADLGKQAIASGSLGLLIYQNSPLGPSSCKSLGLYSAYSSPISWLTQLQHPPCQSCKLEASAVFTSAFLHLISGSIGWLKIMIFIVRGQPQLPPQFSGVRTDVTRLICTLPKLIVAHARLLQDTASASSSMQIASRVLNSIALLLKYPVVTIYILTELGSQSTFRARAI